jgi:hypothetical protein
MRPKRELEKLLESALTARGWSLERVEGLQRVFVRSEVFTPCFWPAIAGRSAGWYSFDGHIGVVDRDFEAIWRKAHGDRNRFLLLMHTANFDELRGFSAEPDAFEEVVPLFAAALDSFLSRLPRSREEMRIAFETDELLGKSMESWKWFHPVPELAELSLKFDEFRAFVGRRQ